MDQANRLRALVTGRVPEADTCCSDRSDGARVIAITSGKGGVGKSTISVNLALLLQEYKKRVLIVDADLGLANVDVMLGIESPRHMGHLLLPDFNAEDIAAEGPGGLRVISGGSGLRELAEAGADERSLLLSKLESYYRRFDFVVVDTSPGIGDGVLDFLRGADDVLLVTSPEPTSLRDAYAAVKTMHHKLPDTEPVIVVNMASCRAEGVRAVGVLNDVATRFLARRFERWGYIENDPIVARTIGERKPLALSFPRSSAAISLRRLAREILESVSLYDGRTCGLEGHYALAQGTN